MSYDHRTRNDPDVLAMDMFNRAYYTGQFKRFVGRLLGRKRRLLVLDEVLHGRQIVDREDLGIQTVRLSEIRGTVSRPDLFDKEFYPLTRSTRNRWISVAAGMLANRSDVPRPDLMLVEDIYFVDDGHHRVSVALRLDYLFLDAKVAQLHLKSQVTTEQPEEV